MNGASHLVLIQVLNDMNRVLQSCVYWGGAREGRRAAGTSMGALEASVPISVTWVFVGKKKIVNLIVAVVWDNATFHGPLSAKCASINDHSEDAKRLTAQMESI